MASARRSGLTFLIPWKELLHQLFTEEPQRPDASQSGRRASRSERGQGVRWPCVSCPVLSPGVSPFFEFHGGGGEGRKLGEGEQELSEPL